MREQVLLNSSINMVETQMQDTTSSGVESEWKAKPPDRPANLLGRQAAHQQTSDAGGGDLHGIHPIQHPIHSLDDSLPQPQPWLPGSVKKKEELERKQKEHELEQQKKKKNLRGRR